ncbi:MULTISPECIES: DUF2999 family protein [unclassified Thalassotalea]|uniref:DUF2999 family protein n=1 Tax=unclassified Thalassotalea TaxID=2614972 RepID=UPI0010808406|nr:MULTISPECIES: DUF2999 family protein [unclassified Thalassotalea]NMP16690.1 DUF2999 family protein [Thalassotalea sp. Y01]QBY05643.1 DUF2999 family protein [Thalassotalea sp. HSM 43]
MNPIIALLKQENISDEQITDLFQQMTENPMVAMATITQLDIPQDRLQPILMQVMSNPALIKDAVSELGLDTEALAQAAQKLKYQS